MILRCLMYPLVVVDTTFLRDPEVGHKNGNGNVNVEVIGLRCVLTQDVKGMPNAMLDGVRHYS